MNTLEQRIRLRIKALQAKYPNQKFNQSWLAKKTNASRASVSKWFNGETKELKNDKLQLAAKALECTPEWLAGFNNANQLENPNVPDYPTFGIVEDQKDLSAYVEFEIYDIKLSAGNGSCTAMWMPTKEDTIMFREAWTRKKGFKPSTHKGLYVKGDSMEPVLKNWDTVLIDTSDTELNSGEIYAILYKDKLFIKEARIQPDRVELVSLNPKYEPIIVTQDDAEHFKCLGRMVWRAG